MTDAGPSERDSPPDINFDSIVVDLCFHPKKDIIAAGDIDGDIMLHSYSTAEANHNIMDFTHHQKACRCLCFSPDGTKLYTGSKDKSLCVVDMDKGAIIHHIKKAHGSPLYSMYVVDENIVATGDDDGNLKVWDARQEKAVMDVKENEEFISDLAIGDNKRLLLATSGEGTLTAFDIRKHKMKMQSEQFDSEMLSLAIMKGGDKVVCGNGEGAVSIFNWGEWGNISDRFPGHPMSIDCMTAFNEDIVFTGSFDGSVRAVNILPNRILGVVGEHGDFPVENMSLSHCQTYLASCSHDQKICFWNVTDVSKEKVDTKRKANKSNKPRLLNKSKAKDDFFAGFAESADVNDGVKDDDDEIDDESGDSEDENQRSGIEGVQHDKSGTDDDDVHVQDDDTSGDDLDNSGSEDVDVQDNDSSDDNLDSEEEITLVSSSESSSCEEEVNGT